MNHPDIGDNFVDVFPVNHLNRFIDYKSMISEKKVNTHSSDKVGIQAWWSILDNELRTDLLFFPLLLQVQFRKCCSGQNI